MKKLYKNTLFPTAAGQRTTQALSHWQATIPWGRVSKKPVAREEDESSDGNSRKKKKKWRAKKESIILVEDMNLNVHLLSSIQLLSGQLFFLQVYISN